MPIFKTLQSTLLALICASLAPLAAAQSTPIHDHSTHEQSTSIDTKQNPATVLDGTFSEVEGDHVLGSPAAPISMIIYASVTCPHCAIWFNSVWPDVKTNYVDNNKLRVVFREFPTSPTNIAVIGFQIANCAPKDQYFEMIEHQMKEQDNIFISLKAGTGKETYLAIAKKAGLETEEAMNTCVASEAGYDRINKSMTFASAAKINTVPNFIINGEVYKSGSDYLPLSKHLNGLMLLGNSLMVKP